MSVTSFSGLRRAAVSSSSLLRRLGDLSVGSQDIFGSRIKIDVSSSVTGTVRKDVQALDQRRHVSWGSIVLQNGFHSSARSLDKETEVSSTVKMNPLQQVPVASDQDGIAASESVRSSFSPSKAGEKRARAILRGARIGPRKLNTFVDVLRGLHIEDALIQCRIHHKKAARMCEKLLMSAKANAVTNHGLDASKLKVEQAWVGKGQYLRRVSIHGRGRSGVMHKHRSHLTVILKEEFTPRKTKVIPMLQERKKWARDS